MQIDHKKDDLEPSYYSNNMKVHIDISCINENIMKTVCSKLVDYSREIGGKCEKVKLPKQIGLIPTLKTPCGQGTKTWAKYKLIVHQTRFVINSSHEQLEKLMYLLNGYQNIHINLSIYD